MSTWRPASPPLSAQPYPPSVTSTAALSSPSTSSVRLIRLLTWVFAILLGLGTLQYVVYQVYHITLVASLDRAYSYQRLQAHYSSSSQLTPLTTPTTHQHPAALTTPAAPPTAAPYHPTFGILVLGDAKAAERYKHHWHSLACYAHRHNYTFITHPNSKPAPPHPCSGFADFFFRKHCTVAQVVQDTPAVDWWLVLDGDVFVVDAEPPLERWLSHPLADPRLAGEYVVTHYERFHNGEVMAGNYIVGNSPRAVQYLMAWAAWEGKIPRHAFHNFDNGALHLHLLSYISGEDSDEYRHVSGMYGHITSWAEYDAYVGAFRCALAHRRLFPRHGLRIVRRGHFAVRDFFVSSEGDRVERVTNVGVVGGGEVMFHGWKEALVGVWWAEQVDGVACMAEEAWTPRLVDGVRVDMAELLRVVRERERYTVSDRGNAVAMQDVSDCFPQCPPELTLAQGEVVRERLCPPAMKEMYAKPKHKPALGAG